MTACMYAAKRNSKRSLQLLFESEYMILDSNGRGAAWHALQAGYSTFALEIEEQLCKSGYFVERDESDDSLFKAALQNYV